MVMKAVSRTLPLLLLARTAHASEQLLADNQNQSLVEPKNCRHGSFDTHTRTCQCYRGWRTAGVTDAYEFVQGICDQYICESDQMCQEALGIEHATCPVKGWNCYCGAWYAFANWGHGYETADGHGGGACMGVPYTFSVWATSTLEWCMSMAWRFVLLLAVVLLPFGKKRTICDHHWPSFWNALRQACGCAVRCDGRCVHSSRYTLDMFRDDVAWSLYIIDLGVWLYIFVIFVYAILLGTVVLAVVALGAISLLFLFGGECCAECPCCHVCSNCSSCPEISFCDVCTVGDYSVLPVDSSVYWGGVFPYDPFWGYSWTANGSFGDPCPCYECQSGCSRRLCRPLAWLLCVFPVMPENAWGGLCGYFLLGTHQLTPLQRVYQGGNALVEFLGMSWWRHEDLHEHREWRDLVYAFLVSDDLEDRELRAGWRAATTDGDQEAITLGHAHAIRVDRSFDLQEDQCVPSSFEDYAVNKCWICMSSNEEWDLWLSCHHLFCKDCSSQMLSRQMPCPLCRVSSSTVLRGKALQQEKASLTLFSRSSSKECSPRSQ